MKKSYSFETSILAEQLGFDGSKVTLDSNATRSSIPDDMSNASNPSIMKRIVSKMKDAESRMRSRSSMNLGARPISGSFSGINSPYKIGRLVKAKGNLKNDCSLGKLVIVQDLKYETTDDDKSILIVPVSATKEGKSIAHLTCNWVMRFNTNGLLLACGRNDGLIILWDKNEKFESTPIHSDTGDFPDAEECINSSTTSGSHQNSSSHHSNAHLDTNNSTPFLLKPKIVFKGHLEAITDVSWSPGDLLLSASLDNTVRLWHPDTQNCLCIFKHPDCVTSLHFHPTDRNIFVTASLDGRIRLWNILLRKLVSWNEVSNDSITAIKFTSDGKTVIVGTLTGLCVFYYTSGLKYNTQISVTRAKSQSQTVKVTGIEIMPSSFITEEKILITTSDSKIRFINLRDKSLFRKYRGFELKSGRSFASFSKDGEYIIVAGSDRNIVIWDKFPQDSNQQYSGILSAVIHRHIDTARSSGQEIFIGSESLTTSAIFAPWTSCNSLSFKNSNRLHGAVVIVSDDQGHVYVYESALQL